MPLYDEKHELVLQEGNIEDMICRRCRRHPCNLFREGSKDFVDVWYHVEGARCFLGKINGHPEIIMTMAM